MTILIAGLAFFLGVHLLPTVPSLHARVRNALGDKPFRGVFSLLSAVGLGLIIYGKSIAPFVFVWPGWAPGFHLSLAIMPVVFVLFAAANMPGYIRAKLRHPMLIGTILWAGIHLSVNGDVASMLLFGSFLVWAVIDLISAIARGKTLITNKPPSLRPDIVAVVAGSVLFWVVARYHAQLFGPVVWPG